MSRFHVAVLAVGLLLPLTSISQAAVIVGDDFNRPNDTNLGSTPIGGFAWNERDTFGNPVDVASISAGELYEFSTGNAQAIVDMNAADLAVSADLRFTNSPEPVVLPATATKAAGINLRLSNMNTPFYYAANRGTVTVQMLPNGGFYIAEQTGAATAFTQRFIGNPFVPGSLVQAFQDPGSLPATFNGAPFDANQNGYLDSSESFRLGAIITGNFLQVQVNGRTILGTALSETGGITGNKLSLLRNNFGGSGVQSNPYWDNLVGQTPSPLPAAMDTFTRADSTNLGTSEVGGYTWYERAFNGAGGVTAPAISGYKLSLGDGRVNHQAILDVSLPNVDATVDLQFDLSGTGAPISGGGLMLRKPGLDVNFTGIAADGQIIVQVLPTGALWVTENQGGAYVTLYSANPWSGDSGYPDVLNFPTPGTLPQYIGGLPFDLNQDGRLGGPEETFQFGAFAVDDQLQVQINGVTLLWLGLAGKGHAGNNYVSVLKNSWATSGTAVNPLYDNITVVARVPEPATAMLLGIGVLALAGFCLRRKRK